MKEIDEATVEGFGYEWSRFRYDQFSDGTVDAVFEDYMDLFPFDALRPGAICIDVGCGTGRWAVRFARKVTFLHLLDASLAALQVAKDNVLRSGIDNVALINAALCDYLPTCKYDAAYSLGVLHHIPDTLKAIRDIARILKPGAPFLVYLYYRFDTRPWWFRALWITTDLLRRVISRLPFWLRHRVCDAIACLVYWPLSRLAAMLAVMHLPVGWLPLSYYRDKSFYVMRTDALDRFGTRLEHRFTRAEIERMLITAGFERITFSPKEPFWTALCYRRAE